MFDPTTSAMSAWFEKMHAIHSTRIGTQLRKESLHTTKRKFFILLSITFEESTTNGPHPVLMRSHRPGSRLLLGVMEKSLNCNPFLAMTSNILILSMQLIGANNLLVPQESSKLATVAQPSVGSTKRLKAQRPLAPSMRFCSMTS